MSPDVYMICPNCQLKAEFNYHKEILRPTTLDTEISMICPVCGEKMVKLVSPDYSDIWDLERRVEDLNRFRDYIPKISEKNQKAVENLNLKGGIINA